MRRETGLQSFVRGLLAGAEAHRTGESYLLADGRCAEADTVTGLLEAGVLAGGGGRCRANGETRAWLKRSLLDANAFAAQHRVVGTRASGASVNLIESPLARLAFGHVAFLKPYHVETGERVRQLVDRAQLQPRLTMTYSASRVAGGAQHKNDISDFAVDARRRLAEIHDQLPAECASVVIDVCGFLKGLQEVEHERGWPRRSAKLVLRIGLEQLARYLGIAPLATGKPHVRPQQWMEAGARPTRFE